MFLLTEEKAKNETGTSGTIHGGSPYQWKIFVWKGKKASLIQFGFAGTKASDLKNKLGENGNFHDCKIFNERQGSESDEFKALFDQEIKASSGNRIKTGVKTKGSAEVARIPKMYEVTQDKLRRIPIRKDCILDDRNYLLDTGKDVYSYSGPKCGRVETAYTQEMARRRCKADYRKKVKAKHVLGRDKKAMAQFHKALKTFEQGKWNEWKDQYDPILFSVNKETGRLVPLPTKSEKDRVFLFDADMLKKNTVFVLDCHSELYIWVGKGTSSAEVHEVTVMVQDLMKLPGRPSFVSLEIMKQNMETIYFKERFFGFDERDLVEIGGGVRTVKDEKEFMIFSKSTKPKSKRVSGELRRVVQFMQEREVDFEKQQELHLLKDDSGTLIGFKYDQKGKMTRLEDKEYGFFETTNMYTYIFSCKNETMHHIFTWEGEHASVRAKAVAGISTTGKDIPGVTEEIMGTKIFKFITQGKEPRLLTKLLEKKTQHYMLKQAIPTERLRNDAEVKEIYIDSQKRKILTFEVNEVGSFGARSCEIPFTTILENGLSSKCCYVIYRGTETKPSMFQMSIGNFIPTEVFFYIGEKATETSIELTKKLSKDVNLPKLFGFQDFITIDTNAFDLAEEINQKELEIVTNDEIDLPESTRPIRLVRVSQSLKQVGSMFIHDVGDGAFAQNDLSESECYLLDTGSTEIYLWVGSSCTNPQVELGIETATRYIHRALPKIKSGELLPKLKLIDSGDEPMVFKCCFYGWQNKKLDSKKGKLSRTFLDKIPKYVKIAKRNDNERKEEEKQTKLKSRRTNLLKFKQQQTLRKTRMKTIQRGKIVSFKKKISEFTMLEKVGDRVEIDPITRTITVVKIGKPLEILQKELTIDDLCKSVTTGSYNWVLFQYLNPKQIQFVERGENGANELMSSIASYMSFDKEGEDTGDNAFYALIKVSAAEINSKLTKSDRLLLVVFVPETTEPILRAAVNIHRNFIIEMLGPLYADTTIRTIEEFDDNSAIQLASNRN